jgi:orotate phosphoribosyltransferase
VSELLDILGQTGAILTGSHFVLTSGKHSPTYINKDALYPHTQQTSRVCRLMAEQVSQLDIDTVVGPALGGIILAQWTAHHLTQIKGRDVAAVYTEKGPDGGQIITRGYDRFVVGKKVAVVEDLMTTGGSVQKAVETIRRAGGDVVAVVAMVNRNPGEITAGFFGTPFFALEALKVETYEEAICPLCKAGVPVNTSVGHGKKYLERIGARAV